MVTNTIIRTYNGIFTMFIIYLYFPIFQHCCQSHDHGWTEFWVHPWSWHLQGVFYSPPITYGVHSAHSLYATLFSVLYKRFATFKINCVRGNIRSQFYRIPLTLQIIGTLTYNVPIIFTLPVFGGLPNTSWINILF